MIANDLSDFGRYAPTGLVARLVRLTRLCRGSWAGRRSAFLLRGIALRALGGRPLDVEALGARMRLYPYNNVCEKRILFTPQFFDPAERALLEARMRPGFVFLDIGANIGGYTLFAAGVAGPGARILAVEPQPEIFERLVYNIRQNAFPGIKAVECALADLDGEITLFVDAANRGGTSMRMVGAGRSGERLTVRAKTLLSLAGEENLSRIDAMKLDVEGAEDLILEPFFAQAPQPLWPRLLLIEHHREEAGGTLIAALARCGYQEVLRTGNKVAYELSGG